MEADKKFDLDGPLVRFGPDAHWSVRSACEGTLILGGIGSGKTSGSYSLILSKLLQAGMGGLLLTVKPQEAEEYRRLCIETGREKDLVELKPGGEHSFNWLEYESRITGDDKPITDNIRELITTCIKAGAEQDVGHGDEGFWRQSLNMLVGQVIDICLLAYENVSLETMYHIVQSLPKMSAVGHSSDQSDAEPTPFQKAWEIAKNKVNAKRHNWHKSLSNKDRIQKLTKAEFEVKLYDAVPEARLLDFLYEFFFDSFKNLNPKTRAIIEFIFSGFMYSLLREPVYSLFSKNPSTVQPEDCFTGKIILVNLPVKKYHETGRNSQLIVKYVCQRAWERRVIKDQSMPVFLAADEAYTFVHEHDALFQATARSAMVCTLAVSQNLSNYMAAMGGEKAKYRVNSLISTLATKVFHANTDMETNEYASNLIGEGYFVDPSTNISMSSKDFTHGQNRSIRREKILPPEYFVSLKCGGPLNNHTVSAIIHKQGDAISKGANHALVSFKQKTNI